jgi:hypothetical protein
MQGRHVCPVGGSVSNGGWHRQLKGGGVDDASVLTFDTAATLAPPTSTLGKAEGCEIVVSI